MPNSMFIFSLMEKSQLCVAYYLNMVRSICILGFTHCYTFAGLRYDIIFSHVAEAGQSTANGDLIYPQKQGNNGAKSPQVAEQNFFKYCVPSETQLFIMPFVPAMKKKV